MCVCVCVCVYVFVCLFCFVFVCFFTYRLFLNKKLSYTKKEDERRNIIHAFLFFSLSCSYLFNFFSFYPVSFFLASRISNNPAIL